MGHFAGKDIVARLRDAEPCADGHPCKAKEAKSGCCCAEAADTIEQMRVALGECRGMAVSAMAGDIEDMDALSEINNTIIEALGDQQAPSAATGETK